jgi:hypothetical protein
VPTRAHLPPALLCSQSLPLSDSDELPLELTQFVFRKLLTDTANPTDLPRVDSLWDQFGSNPDDCALALLELQSRLNFESREDVIAASKVLLAAAISAHERGDLIKQVQLGRTLEMIADKTQHEPARATIREGLQRHELLFDPELFMLARSEYDERLQQDGNFDSLAYLRGPTGGLEFVDEFLTRDSEGGLFVRTLAMMPARTDSQTLLPSAAPFQTTLYELSVELAATTTHDAGGEAVGGLRKLRLPISCGGQREVFESERARIGSIHAEVARQAPAITIDAVQELITSAEAHD